MTTKSPQRIFGLLVASLLVASLLPLVAVTSSPVQAQTPKFNVTFEIDTYLTYEVLYITVQNLQDSSDALSMETILSDTNFPISQVTITDFAVEKLETYEENIIDWGWVEYFENEIYENRWEIIGSHLEDRESLVWQSKALTNRNEDGEKGELKNQWEEIQIQKAGQAKDTKRFRFTFNHPIVAGANGWGSRGTISLNLNGVIFVDNENSSWWDSNWSNKKQIQIDHTKVENENFTNFPVLISWTSDSDLAAHAMDNGDDIAFVNSAEDTQLDHEIENFVGDNGQLVAHIREPTLYDNENTILWMYYGNPSASNQENPTGVWDDNFVMVMHMGEDPSGASPQIRDSVSDNHDGYSYGTMTSGDLIDGKIGKCLDFDGSDDVISFSTAWMNFQPRVWEAWIRGPLDVDDVRMFMGETRVGIGSVDTDGTWGTNRIGVHLRDGGSIDHLGKTGLTPEQWYYVVLMIPSNGGTTRFYIDGVEEDTEALTSLNDTFHWFGIGAAAHTTLGVFESWTEAEIDEVRVSNVVRTAGWIKTTFNNQNDPSTFYSVGAEETSEVEEVHVYPPDVYVATTWTVPGETVKVSVLVLDANNTPISDLPSDNVNYDLWSPQSNLVAENVGLSETSTTVSPGLYENSWAFAVTDNTGTWTVYVAVDSAGTHSYSIAHIRLEPSIVRIENKVDWVADYLENTIKPELDNILDNVQNNYTYLSGTIKPELDQMRDNIDRTLDNAVAVYAYLTGTVKPAIDNTYNQAVANYDYLTGTIKPDLDNILENVADLSQVYENCNTIYNYLVDNVKPELDNVYENVNATYDYLISVINLKLDEIAAGVMMEVTRYYQLSIGDLQEFYVTIMKGTNVDWVTITLEDPDGSTIVDNTSMSNPETGSYYYSFSTSVREAGGWLTTIVAKDENLTATYRGFWRLGWGEEEPVGYLTLTILDDNTSEPIEHAKVELYRDGSLIEKKYTRWDGKAWLDIMVWDTHELMWSAEGYESDMMEIDLTVSSTVTLKLVPVEMKPLFPPLLYIIGALIFGCVLVPLVHYGSRKKAGVGSLLIAFILPIVLLAVVWVVIL